MDPQRPRLLVVDDDQTILTLIDRIAVAEGFDVDTTADSSDALVHLFKRPADLVLLDVRMPGVSGLDVLRSMRGMNSQPKVVLMTGYGSIENAVEAVKLGATDYVTKPFDVARLGNCWRDVRAEAERARRAALERDVAHRSNSAADRRGPASGRFASSGGSRRMRAGPRLRETAPARSLWAPPSPTGMRATSGLSP